MDFPGTSHADRDWTKPVQDMPLDKGFDYFFGIPASLNYGVLAWFEGRHAKVPPTVFTAKKPNQRHVDYRIMPPYQATPAETRKELGKAGMEVAPDFIDNQCLTRFTDKAIEWMSTSKQGDKPFFLYLPFTSPHYPVCPLPQFHGQGDCGGYGEFVIETDHHVGRILKFLEEAGIDDNTMIIFTSDNGPENSWKKRIEDFGHHSNAIYRGGKRDIYEGGHRVPFFIRWPGGIEAPGRTCDDLIGQTDLLATLADLVGQKLPDTAGEDSQSFAALFEEPFGNHHRLPLINHGSAGRFAITEGEMKLVMPHKKFPSELYNLSTDPGEENDLAAKFPDLVAELTKKLTKIVTQGRTTTGARQPNDTGYWKDLTWIKPAEYDR
jgi:arylsulfatase A